MTKDGLTRLKGWARDGLTDEQIATKIGINRTTLYKWIDRFSDIGNALKQGKEPVDIDVEDSMVKLALGHYVTVKKPMKIRTEKRLKKKDKDGREYETGVIVEEHIEYVDEQVYIPPNVTAQIFWLKNRKPEQWKDKREQVVSTRDGVLADLISGLKEPVAESFEAEAG